MMEIEIEGKIMTKKRFSLAVEKLVASSGNGISYIDAACAIIEERGLNYSNLKRLLTPSLKVSPGKFHVDAYAWQPFPSCR